MVPSLPFANQSRRSTLEGISVQTPLGDDAFVVTGFQYAETLGQPFEILLELQSKGSAIDASSLVGKPFTVSLRLPGGGTRYFNAIMGTFTRQGHGGDVTQYRAIGIPWYSLLKLAKNSQIFQNVTVRDVFTQIFAAYDFCKYEVTGFYPKTLWETCTQYRETSFDFIQRLLEQEGIYYFWKHEKNHHTLKTCDTISNHGPFSGYSEIPYRSAELGQQVDEHIYQWNCETAIQSSCVVLKDYNYNSPDESLEKTQSAKAPLGPDPLEAYDYPGFFQNHADCERYVQVRMEAKECCQNLFRGRAQCLAIAAGFKFILTGFPVSSENGWYLTTEMRLTVGTVNDDGGGENRSREAAAGFSDGSVAYWYDCEFTAIPDGVQYRSNFTASVPQVFGLQPAFVYAPDGQNPQTPYTDSLGRIQLLFPWNRNGKQTAWVRKAQVMAGNGWGHVHCPRPGDEVLVAFEYGNVDRPVIVGCLYNGKTQLPLPMPESAHIHVFKDQGGNLFTLNPQEDGQTVTLSSPVASTVLTLVGDTPNPS